MVRADSSDEPCTAFTATILPACPNEMFGGCRNERPESSIGWHKQHLKSWPLVSLDVCALRVHSRSVRLVGVESKAADLWSRSDGYDGRAFDLP